MFEVFDFLNLIPSSNYLNLSCITTHYYYTVLRDVLNSFEAHKCSIFKAFLAVRNTE